MEYPRFQKLKEWLRRYERHLSSAALLAGFIIDNLTLQRIDLLFENLILLFYLSLAVLGILLINLYEAKVLRGRIFEWLRLWAPLGMQFAFGALFSGFVIFYSRSASVAASWPFLILLAGLLIGNEAFRKFYSRLTFQLSIFYVALFSLSIYQLPILLGRMGAGVFLLSGIVSLAVISLFIFLLSRLIRVPIEHSKKILAVSIGGIFLLINFFYFTNILPPIPLALKEAGVYQQIVRTATGFSARGEERSWYQALWPSQTIHLSGPRPVYVYSAVFAPTRISTEIVHHWQYYDPAKSDWVSSSKIRFSISGGRDGGYRGYTMKQATFPGLWRVNVETPRGQVIGRIKFRIEYVATPPDLETREL